MIDKIYILNLERDKRRLGYTYRELLNSEFPQEKIFVWTAKSCQPYEKTVDLCTAAAAEGFRFFQNIIDNESYKQCSITYLALTWGYLRFYRHLQETGETAILMHDDMYFRCTYEELDTVCKQLPNTLIYAFLHYVITPEYWDKDCLYHNTVWRSGIDICGSDVVMLYTPKGAQYLLTLSEKLQHVALGWWLQALRDNPPTDLNASIFNLVINPTQENRQSIGSIIKHFNKGDFDTGGYKSATYNIPEIQTSSIHQANNSGKILRPIDTTH